MVCIVFVDDTKPRSLHYLAYLSGFWSGMNPFVAHFEFTYR